MSDNTANLTAFIQEAFGSNATYVEGLLTRYKQDRNSVDSSWQEYFGTLLAGGAPSVDGGNGRPAAAPAAEPQPTVETAAAVAKPAALQGLGSAAGAY